MTGADNQLITVRVRVRQVSADLWYINIDICRDIGKVSIYGRWSLIREVIEGRFYCIFDTFAISFMYIMNISGPNMDPWGTPQVTFMETEVVLLYDTNCFLSFK